MPFKSSGYIETMLSESSSFRAQLCQNLDQRRYVYRSIMLINGANDERILTEGAPIAVDQTNCVYFNDMIVYLRQQNLLPAASSVFFFDIERNVFVHQGREPVPSHILIPLSKFAKDEIKIKYRAPERPSFPTASWSSSAANTMTATTTHSSSMTMNSAINQRINCKEESSSSSNCHPGGMFQQSAAAAMDLDEEEMNLETNSRVIPREKRVKERKIGYVRERVMEWRRYYEVGVPCEQGKVQKVNLDVAAGLIGLSRKTLDDYYKYIRKAEQYGFDFQARSEEKIGVLRNFVRDRQKRNEALGKHKFSKEFDEDYEDLQEETFKREETHLAPSPAPSSNNIQSSANSPASCAPPMELPEQLSPSQLQTQQLTSEKSESMEMEMSPTIDLMNNSCASMNNFDFNRQMMINFNTGGYDLCQVPSLLRGASVNSNNFNLPFDNRDVGINFNNNWRHEGHMNHSGGGEWFDAQAACPEMGNGVDCENFLASDNQMTNNFNDD